MTAEEEKITELWETRAQIATKKLWFWLKYFVNTKDEHDNTTLRKAFPAKAYFRFLTRMWNECDVAFMEKSRQMMMSWFFSAAFLHDALFNYNRKIFLQSKKQEDADALLNRCRHIYDACTSITYPLIGNWLPEVTKAGQRSGTISRMEFLKIGSDVEAIPQGPDIVRSHTISGLFADEDKHQRQFAEGYAAAMPAIGDGARYWAIGTPNGRTFSYFVLNGIDDKTGKSVGAHRIDSRRIGKSEKLFHPPVGLTSEERRYWIESKLVNMPEDEFNAIPLEQLAAVLPGVDYWVTADNMDCVRIHYTADPDKDPKTVIGAEWVKNAKRRMKSRTKWEREMEINYDTSDGRPVISNWETSKFVKECGSEYDYNSDFKLDLSFDFGNILCGCLIAQWVFYPEYNMHQLRFIDEVIMENSNTPFMAEAVVKRLNENYLLSWENNNIESWCDPNGNRGEATNSDKSMDTHVKILEAFEIFPDSTKYGVPESTELMETVFYMELPNGEPSVVILERCTYFIRVLGGGLVFPEGGRPGYYDKDGYFDHGGDMGRYQIANRFDERELNQAGKAKPEKKEQLGHRSRTGQYQSGRKQWNREKIVRRMQTSRYDYA